MSIVNLNALRTAMKRDHDQAQQIEDEELYQREKEREEAAWQEYLDDEAEKEQSTKTDNANIVNSIQTPER
jgi:hypothetical protein